MSREHLVWVERGAIAAALLVSAALAVGWIGCGACRAGVPLAGLGLVYYALLLAAHVFAPDGTLTRHGIVAAFSAHAGLVYLMSKHDQGCAGCMAAAAAAAVAFIARTWREPGRSFSSFAFLCPAVNVALLVVVSMVMTVSHAALASEASGPETADASAASVTIYELSGCVHCERLRAQTLPEVRQRFGARLAIRFVDARLAPGIVAWTPTLVVRGPSGHRVLEGFQTVDQLLGALAECGVFESGAQR